MHKANAALIQQTAGSAREAIRNDHTIPSADAALQRTCVDENIHLIANFAMRSDFSPYRLHLGYCLNAPKSAHSAVTPGAPVNHFQTTPLSNAVLLLMAMLDDRREPLDAAAQRRAVLGALKSWASGGLPTPAAVEQAFDDAQEVLARFLAYRAADSATPVAIEVREIASPTRRACLTTGRVCPGGAARDLCNQQRKTVTSVLGGRS